jgi:hypothetical protein
MSEKRKLRFGVEAPDGRRSRVWTVSAKATGSDVYLIPRRAPCDLHFSLHNDDYWHIQVTREEGKDPSPLGVVPQPILGGKLTRAFLVAIAQGGLAASAEQPDSRVHWWPAPTAPGHWTHFDVLFEAPGAAGAWGMRGGTVLGRIPRGDGGAVFVTAHDAPLDTARLEVASEMFGRSDGGMAAGQFAAMLIVQHEDASWRVVEGPIESAGPNGFEVACDQPWNTRNLAAGRT